MQEAFFMRCRSPPPPPPPHVREVYRAVQWYTTDSMAGRSHRPATKPNAVEAFWHPSQAWAPRWAISSGRSCGHRTAQVTAM